MLQPVRGTHDIYGEDYLKYQFVSETARTIAGLYGFESIETPIFEFASVFLSMGESSDVVTKETYTFEDRGGERVTLRPEGTAGVMRAIVSNGLTQHIPLKYFYAGPMFRYERPQKGRYRQFHHIGVELVGVEKAQADIEVLAMAHQILKALELDGELTLNINTLGDIASRDAYREALINYLTPYRGELSVESQQRLERNPLRILDSKDEKDRKILVDAPSYKNYWNTQSQAFFEDVLKGLEALNISYVVNPALVRGLDYYCHTVFEFISNSLGAQGTVLAGGRYDGLTQRMGGKDLPGVGWAGGIERLMLLSKKLLMPARPIALIPLGERAEAHAQNLAHTLRLQDIYVELAYGGNLSKRMKQANKVSAWAAVIFGDDELEQNQYTLKNLDHGIQMSVAQSDLLAVLESEEFKHEHRQ